MASYSKYLKSSLPKKSASSKMRPGTVLRMTEELNTYINKPSRPTTSRSKTSQNKQDKIAFGKTARPITPVSRNNAKMQYFSTQSANKSNRGPSTTRKHTRTITPTDHSH